MSDAVLRRIAAWTDISLASHHRHADHDRMESEGKREIGDDADRDRNQVVADTADGDRRAVACDGRDRQANPPPRNAIQVSYIFCLMIGVI